MAFEFVTKTFEDTNVMYISKSLTMEQWGEIGPAFTALVTYGMQQNGGEILGSFMLYNECTETRMDVDCCIEVKSLLPESGEIKAKVVPGGSFFAARAVHEGPYSGLTQTWEDLMKWVEQEGCVFESVPMREIYLNMPMEVPENELLTEIIAPVKKA